MRRMSWRKNIMLGTAGHVDHGKTALVKVLTGCNTDTLAAEKQRGLTIELGFAPCQMNDERIVGIIDVPGHANFIRNMVAGAHGIDVVIFVVAADDGVMPQTHEHLDILTLMGVRHGLVALTKIDMVDDALREMAVDDVRGYLQGTFLADAPICPVSNITGAGYDGLLGALNEAVALCEQRVETGLFRMWVERSFSIKGFGTVASGIPASGRITPGESLTVLPANRKARLRQLEVYGRNADEGRSGECVAMNLDDVDLADLPRGGLLCTVGAFEPVAMAEASLTILPAARRALADYAEVHLHVGTGDVMAHVALLEGQPISPGGNALVQLRMLSAMPVAAGDRFVIRAPAGERGILTTIGGGQILDTSNRRLRRNRPWTLAALRARQDAIGADDKWCDVVLAECQAPVTAEQLAYKAHLPVDQVERLLPTLVAANAIGARWLHTTVLSQAGERIATALQAFHEQNPMRDGADVVELREAADLDGDVFPAALERLLAEGRIDHPGGVVVLKGREAVVSDEDRALCKQLEQVLRDAHLEPPLPAELAERLGVGMPKLDELLQLLADQQLTHRLDEKVVMHHDAVAAAEDVVIGLFAKASGFSTMEFRDALGVSRKFAVPLLDYFDTVKLTVRRSNRRTPGVAAKQRLESDDQGAPCGED